MACRTGSSYRAGLTDETVADIPDERGVELAAATLEVKLKNKLSLACGVDTQSLSGAALAMPQIARSAGWSRMLTALSIRAYLFLLMTFLLQVFLLYMINKAESVMDYYGDQMNLCDFGHCQSEHCYGPTGTEYTPARMYSWDQFILRGFVRSTLLSVFPEKEDEINERVDIGEYGLQDFYCRLAGCFVFMFAVTEDLVTIIRLVRLLIKVPNNPEPWIRYARPAWDLHQEQQDGDESISATKQVQRFSQRLCQNCKDKTVHEDHVQVHIAGMSIKWKVINCIFVLLPKIVVWRVTAEAGITFLMETADIVNTIINAAALSVVLSLERIVFESMTTRAVKYLLAKIENVSWYEEEDYTEDGVLNRYYANQKSRNFHLDIRECFEWLPLKLVGVIICTVFFVGSYYHRRCDWKDGGFVSKPVYTPTSTHYNLAHAFLPNFFSPGAFEDEPFWTMPEPTEA